MSILLSIVIPAYNAEQYIEEAINSILVVEESNLEIIIVNDGSNDCTEMICRKIINKDKRVKLISVKNGGVSSARNRGIDECTGKYITFLDADDIIIGDTLNEMMHSIESLEYDLGIFSYQIVNKAGKFERRVCPFRTATPNEKEIFKCIAVSTYMNFCWGKVYRSDFIKQNKIRFKPTLKIGEDIEFQIQLLKYKPNIFYINQDLVKYRQVPSSVMHRYDFSRFKYLVNDYYMRKEMARLAEMESGDYVEMYNDLGNNLLSYIRQISKLKPKYRVVKNLKREMNKSEIVEIFNNMSVSNFKFHKKVIIGLIKIRMFYLVVLILSFF